MPSRCRALLACFLLILLPIPPAPCQAPVAASRSAVSGPAASARAPTLDANEFLRIVTDLADESMDGRGAGTEGIEKARDYIAAHLQAAGLKPPFRGSFTQVFEAPLGRTIGAQSLKLQEVLGKDIHQARPQEDFAALAFSPAGRFAGKPVLVGYGIVNPQAQYDSYAGQPNALRGRVAVAMRYEPQDSRGRSLWAAQGQAPPWSPSASLLSKAEWAAQRGAVALVVANPPSQDQDEELGGSAQAAFAGRAKIPVVHISTVMFQRILQAGGEPADPNALREFQDRADRGADGPKALEEVVLRGEITLKRSGITLHNVAGLLPGQGALADQVVLIGAHYDHVGRGEFGSRAGRRVVHPGADDNASGTAAVILLARRFEQLVADGQAPADRRALVFAAFCGEEIGLLGASHMARHLDDLGLRADRLVAMLNLDMIGRLRNDRAYVLDADSGDRWRELLAGARQAAGIELRTPGGVGGRGDHGPFYRYCKVPVLHFFTGEHADYHKPSDTADRINAPGAVKVMTAVASVADHLWGRPDRIAYVPPPPGSRTGPTAYLGVGFDPTAGEAEGMAILTVEAGGPADLAGLHGGDVVVRWNDQAIKDIRSLMAALTAGKPDQKVKLTVLRDGKSVELEVTLGRRP